FRRFPECPEFHLILGEIYLRRYLEDKMPEDGRWAAESLERASRLDPEALLPRKYLAGLYARIGYFRPASEFLSALDIRNLAEGEQCYIRELHGYCSRRADTEEDVERCLARVRESGTFAVDCGDWAAPEPPAFGRRDFRSMLVPLAAMEVTARKWLALPGVKAVVVQNQVRSKTLKADDVDGSTMGLEQVVGEVTRKSVEACHRMGLGHVRRCDLRTTVGALSIHTFADTWAGVQFDKGASDTQVRTVTQQCLDLMAECAGEIHENNSREP
ncbi:MAG TPA: hypothetical protein VMZ92_05310, partial [Planctomycetota bacterium]|nr:hypothetical protein [Planctomycetota bacterium]